MMLDEIHVKTLMMRICLFVFTLLFYFHFYRFIACVYFEMCLVWACDNHTGLHKANCCGCVNVCGPELNIVY